MILHWALIIYISSNAGYAGGPATIEGFLTYKSCREAGDKLNTVFDKDGEMFSYGCVEVK